MSFSIARCVFVTAMASALLACTDKLSGNDQRAIHAWLTCDDCSGGERSAVEAMGDKAVGALSEALSGPSVEQISIMKHKFDTSYKIAEMANRVPGLSAAAYSNFRQANYTANYQKRAALALGDIGTDAARKALDAAIADSVGRNYRPDVIRVIKFARSTIGTATFVGTIKPPRVSFGDIAVVKDTGGLPFPTTAKIVIEDSLFPPDQIPSAVKGDSIVFLSVAAFGLHMVDIYTDPNRPPDKLTMFVETIDDANDRGMTTCGPNDIACMIGHAQLVLVGHTMNQVPTFFTLSDGSTADKTDFFKVANPGASPLPVTARLDWRGNGLINLEWKICGTTTSVGHSAAGTQSHTMTLSDPIPATQCWVLQATLASGAGPVFGRLIITSP